MTETPYVPAKVAGIDRELAHVDDEEKRLLRELEEARERQTVLVKRRKEALGED